MNDKRIKSINYSEYITGSVKLFLLYLPFLSTNLSTKLYQVVDDVCIYTLGSNVILALTTFSYLKHLIDTPFEAVKYGFLYIFTRSKYKNDTSHSDTRDLISSYIILQVFILILTSITTGLLLKPVTSLFSLSGESNKLVYVCYFWAISWLIFECFNTAYEQILNVQRKQKITFCGLLIQTIINVTGDLLSLHLDWGLSGIYLATLLAEMFKFLFYYIYSGIHFCRPTRSKLYELIMLGKSMLVNRVLQRSMYVFMGYFCSTLGAMDYLIYTTAQTISSKLEEIFIHSSVDSHLVYTGEYIASKQNNEDSLRVKKFTFKGTLLLQTLTYYITQSLIYFIIFTVGSRVFYNQMHSEVSWGYLKPILFIMFLGSVLFYITACFRNLFNTHYLFKYVNIITALGFIIRISLSLLFLFVLNYKSVVVFTLIEPIELFMRFLSYVIIYIHFRKKGVFTV